MKKLLLLSGLMVAALGAYAQGTITFANGAPGVDAPITNGIPGSPSPMVRASGPTFQTQLYIGPAGSGAGALTTNGVSGTSAPLGTGATAGYFFGGARDIAGFASGSTIAAQVRAWSTAAGATSWETATAAYRGESNVIPVILGGGQTPPANMIGLQSFIIGVPEPSSIALGLLGLGAIVLFRRRK